MTQNELVVSAIAAGYGNRAVVREVSICVKAGEIVIIAGANGAGKTTLLQCIGGQLPAMAGSVCLNGEVQPRSLQRRARNGIVLVPEERWIFRTLTVAENLRMCGREATEVVRFFPELIAHMPRKAGLLSGGQQQMLSLAGTLGYRPKFLLVDELTLGLAPMAVGRLLTSLREIASSEGVGVILVEQHVRKALPIADRGYVLAGGEIAMSGSAQHLWKNIAEVEKSYLGDLGTGPEPSGN
jgi:branched-chain amino acid transport system ATP-binding protein